MPIWDNSEAYISLTFSDCSNKFRCLSDGVCVDLWRRCDSISDCLDGSDETNCPGK